VYRERVGGPAPWHYYASIIALIAMAGFAAAGERLEAGLCFAAWGVMTAMFFCKRIRKTSKDTKHVLEMGVTSALIPPAAIFWRLAGALKYRVWFF
jgi:hypothetical protein